MTDMFTGMPFYWTGANPVNVVPPNQALANNLAQNTAANQANSQAASAASAQAEANGRAFMDWSRGTNANMQRLTDATIMSNLAIGNRQPTGAYIGNRRATVFDTGTKPFNDYGGIGGSQIFDPGKYYTKNPDVWSSGADAWKHYNQYGQNENRGGAWSSIFNEDAYKQKNPDVAASGMDPTQHWFDFGLKEQRQGAQTFDPGKYLVQNPDVWKAGADPWRHWNMFGEKEGRKGSWTDAFNPETYRKQNPDVAAAGVDPTAHWYEFGSKEGRRGGWGGQLSPLQSYQGTGFDAFDPNIYTGSHPTAGFGNQPSATATKQDWQDLWNTRGPFNRSPQDQSSADDGRSALAADYYAANRDVYDAARASGRDPTEFGIEHLMAFGQDEGRGFFDEQGYLQQNPDVAASGVDPTAHWFNYGQNEGRAAPTGKFNSWEYNLANPDVVNANMDAMQHYMTFGQNEGRAGGWEWSSRNRGSPWPDRMAATPAMEGNDPRLAAQRQAYADSVRNDPEKRILLAARLHAELGNDPVGRTGITEAMLNRLIARGIDPLNLNYYPKDAAAIKHYNESLALMRSDPNMVNSVMGDAERAFAGSNYSQHATDWASQVAGMTVAERARVNSNATWTSPANEEFFIKNIPNADTGKEAARQIQAWYDSVTQPSPR